MINYPEHIAPIWTRDRGANTCTNCHVDSAKLDLRATTGGTGRVISYEELVLGDPLIDVTQQEVRHSSLYAPGDRSLSLGSSRRNGKCIIQLRPLPGPCALARRE